MVAKSIKKQTQPTAPVSQPAPPSKTTPSPIASAKVNAFQSPETSDGKNKGKNKSKKPDNQQEGNKSPNHYVNSKGKRKVKYTCLICGGDYFTKEFPHREEFNNFLKSSPTQAVLKDPFPTQKQLIDHQSSREET